LIHVHEHNIDFDQDTHSLVTRQEAIRCLFRKRKTRLYGSGYRIMCGVSSAHRVGAKRRYHLTSRALHSRKSRADVKSRGATSRESRARLASQPVGSAHAAIALYQTGTPWRPPSYTLICHPRESGDPVLGPGWVEVSQPPQVSPAGIAVEDGVASLAYDPRVHLLRKNIPYEEDGSPGQARR